jgi:hypothetical protein
MRAKEPLNIENTTFHGEATKIEPAIPQGVKFEHRNLGEPLDEEAEGMKWELTDDQKALVKLIHEHRTMMISAEEFATIITEAGFRREQTATQTGTPDENISDREQREFFRQAFETAWKS